MSHQLNGAKPTRRLPHIAVNIATDTIRQYHRIVTNTWIKIHACLALAIKGHKKAFPNWIGGPPTGDEAPYRTS